MEKFSTFEHDTLLSFLPFIEQKVNTGYRSNLSSGTLPQGVLPGSEMEARFTRAVNNFNKNLEAIKKNKPGSLTGQQWDDLVFIFSIIESDVSNNAMIQPLFGNSAGKCYHILLDKRAERLVPFQDDSHHTEKEQKHHHGHNYHPTTPKQPTSVASLHDLADKAFNRGLIAQVGAFVGLLAFITVMLVNPRAFWAYLFLLLAVIAQVNAFLHLRLSKRIRKQIDFVLPAADGNEILSQPESIPEAFLDNNAKRFLELVRDPQDYAPETLKPEEADAVLAAGRARAADQLGLPAMTRYVNASLLRYDLLGIGHCIKNAVTRNGSNLYLEICSQIFAMIQSDLPVDRQQAIFTMVEKTTHEVFTIALDQIESNARSQSRSIGHLSHYIHTFDLFINLFRITDNPFYLRFVTDRIDRIESRLSRFGSTHDPANDASIQRILAYKEQVEQLTTGKVDD